MTNVAAPRRSLKVFRSSTTKSSVLTLQLEDTNEYHCANLKIKFQVNWAIVKHLCSSKKVMWVLFEDFVEGQDVSRINSNIQKRCMEHGSTIIHKHIIEFLYEKYKKNHFFRFFFKKKSFEKLLILLISH